MTSELTATLLPGPDGEGRRSKAAPDAFPLDHDPSWRGVVDANQRKCKDVAFAALFAVAMVVAAFTWGIGFARGDLADLPVVGGGGGGGGNGDGGNSSRRGMSGSLEGLIGDAAGVRDLTAVEAAMGTLAADRGLIFVGAVVAVVLAAIWSFLLKHFARLLVWATVGIAEVLLASGTVYFLVAGARHGNTLLVLTGVGCGVAVLVLGGAALYFRDQIRLTELLISEASLGIRANPSLVGIALAILVVVVAYVAVALAAVLHLYAAGGMAWAIYYNVFVFYWVCALLSGLFQVTVGGSLASWYFTRGDGGSQSRTGATLQALALGATTSFGSLALGSLLVAIVAFASFLLRRAQRANRHAGGLVRAVIACVLFCLSCLRGYVEYANRKAYVYCAMYGDGYCGAAKRVTALFGRSGLSLVFVDTLSGLVLTAGKLCGTLISLVVTVAAVTAAGRDVYLPTFGVVACVSYFVFHLFAHITAAGIDTVTICYLEDLERNSESGRFAISPDTHTAIQMVAASKGGGGGSGGGSGSSSSSSSNYGRRGGGGRGGGQGGVGTTYSDTVMIVDSDPSVVDAVVFDPTLDPDGFSDRPVAV